MRKNTINPALRQAIILANPNYFAWDKSRQDAYGVSLPEKDHFAIVKHLYKKLVGINIKTAEELKAIKRDVSNDVLNTINAAMLPLVGIGADCFQLNEYFGEKTLLDFETLRDFDLYDHEFQETARKQDLPNYEIQPYTGSFYLSWARFLQDDALVYATLSMASGYIFSEIEEHGQNYIDTLIPHTYVAGKNHGKPEGKGVQFDFRIQANGKEAELKELKMRFIKNYLQERYKQYIKDWIKFNKNCVFTLDKVDEDGVKNPHFIFSDPDVLKVIKFRNFVSDCAAVKEANQPLFDYLDIQKKHCQNWLDAQVQDIHENFDPNVVKLERKPKIILHPDAANDLL